MIGFQINGEFLDLPADRQVELNRNSPFFQQDGFIVEDFTLPVSFPNTPKNMRLLDWPHIVENAARLKPRWNAVLFYNGVPRLKGEMRAQRPINSKIISLNFVSGISSIGEDIKERSLRDILDETFVIHELAVTKKIILDYIAVGSTSIAIRINGANYTGGSLADLVTNINADIEATVTASSALDVLTITSDLVGEFEPFYVEIPETTRFYMNSGAPAWNIDLSEAFNLFVADHVGSARLFSPLRFGTFYNFDKFFTDELPQKSIPVVNNYSAGDFVSNKLGVDVLNNPIIFNLNSLAPMVTVKYVLEKIEEYYDITINFDKLNADDVFFHNFTLDRPTSFFKDTFNPDRKLILFESSFNTNQLVPDIKINDLIKALQIGYNAQVSFDISRRTLTISSRTSAIITRDYIDITDDCTPPSHVQLSTQRGLKFTLAEDGSDELERFDQGPVDYLFGEGQREINIGFGAPAMYQAPSEYVFINGILIDYQPQYTAAISQGSSEKFGFRLARYIDASRRIDSTAFLLQGVNGIIATHWTDGITLENDPVMIENQWLMTREQAFNIDWSQKWRIDRSDYLLRNFNVTMMANGLAMADTSFVRVPTFKIQDITPPATSWIGDPSTLTCVKDANNLNTGMARYSTLIQIITATGIPTGSSKTNAVSDPDYIAPFMNEALCPIGSVVYTNGYLYIQQTPIDPGNPSTLSLNLVQYNQPNAPLFAVPYPFMMPDGTTGVSYLPNNNGPDILKYTLRSYRGTILTNTQTRFVYPGNNVLVDGVLTNDETYRRMLFSTLLNDWDTAFPNRLVITVEII